MNTGADDDSLSTPTLAFCSSSARASPLAAIASRPASISRIYPGRATRARVNCVIQFPPSSRIIRKSDPDRALAQCLGNGGELPLPLAGEGWGGGAAA